MAPWNTKRRFLAAERTQESGGDYQAVNSSSGALGAYQVMPANLAPWLARSGQRAMTPDAYLQCDRCQDRLAYVVLGGDYDTWGPAGAAAVWYSGQPDPTATYGNPPVYQYVDDVLALMHDPHLHTAPPPPGSTGAAAQMSDWSPAVRRGADHAGRTAARMVLTGALIRSLHPGRVSPVVVVPPAAELLWRPGEPLEAQ